MQYAKSPEPQSLAVQSAFVNPKQLARIYLAYHTQQRGIALELLVYEYITGSEPGVLHRICIAISSLLQGMEVRQSSPAALSSSVLSGEWSVADGQRSISLKSNGAPLRPLPLRTRSWRRDDRSARLKVGNGCKRVRSEGAGRRKAQGCAHALERLVSLCWEHAGLVG